MILAARGPRGRFPGRPAPHAAPRGWGHPLRQAPRGSGTRLFSVRNLLILKLSRTLCECSVLPRYPSGSMLSFRTTRPSSVSSKLFPARRPAPRAPPRPPRGSCKAGLKGEGPGLPWSSAGAGLSRLALWKSVNETRNTNSTKRQTSALPGGVLPQGCRRLGASVKSPYSLDGKKLFFTLPAHNHNTPGNNRCVSRGTL